jgi:hypothetical protein
MRSQIPRKSVSQIPLVVVADPQHRSSCGSIGDGSIAHMTPQFGRWRESASGYREDLSCQQGVAR